jgi:hypothetical protein
MQRAGRRKKGRQGRSSQTAATPDQLEDLVMAGKMTVTEAVQRDLDRLGDPWATSGLAASALSLAASMDDAKISATARSNCARSLQDALAVLRKLAPAARKADGVDELRAKRRRRRAAG